MNQANNKVKRVPEKAVKIGHNLREIRLWKGYSQREIAKVVDVTAQQIQKYETGENRLPIEKLFLLKFFFNVPYDQFFSGLLVPCFTDDDANTRFPSIVMYKALRKVKDKSMQKRITKIVKILAS